MSAVLRFAGQAKRSGAADTYAIARRELDADDLGCLLLHLRRIDPDWRAPLRERRALAAALLEAGVRDSAIIEQTGISRTTLWRIRRNVADKPKCVRKPALQSGGFVSNGATLTNGSSGRILSADATSANGDLEAIRALLGART
jgi:Homeodomain-like domain